MAVTKGNGFPFWAQPAHLRFVSIARSIPLRVAHPPPELVYLNVPCPSGWHSSSETCVPTLL